MFSFLGIGAALLVVLGFAIPNKRYTTAGCSALLIAGILVFWLACDSSRPTYSNTSIDRDAAASWGIAPEELSHDNFFADIFVVGATIVGLVAFFLGHKPLAYVLLIIPCCYFFILLITYTSFPGVVFLSIIISAAWVVLNNAHNKSQ